jgi:hypothetical protein
MEKDYLILKCASVSRPSGEWGVMTISRCLRMAKSSAAFSLGFFRLGVSQQHHAHGFSNDFPRAVV